MKQHIKRYWDITGEFYKEDGNITMEELGNRFSIHSSTVHEALKATKGKKFSQLPEIDNKLLPNNSNKQ